MMRDSYSLLHPAALAVASGVGALILAVLGGFGMMGAGSMMGGGYPGYHMALGAGFVMLIRAFVFGTIVGWIVGLVYNAIVRRAPEPDSAAALPTR